MPTSSLIDMPQGDPFCLLSVIQTSTVVIMASTQVEAPASPPAPPDNRPWTWPSLLGVSSSRLQ